MLKSPWTYPFQLLFSIFIPREPYTLLVEQLDLGKSTQELNAFRTSIRIREFDLTRIILGTTPSEVNMLILGSHRRDDIYIWIALIIASSLMRIAKASRDGDTYLFEVV